MKYVVQYYYLLVSDEPNICWIYTVKYCRKTYLKVILILENVLVRRRVEVVDVALNTVVDGTPTSRLRDNLTGTCSRLTNRYFGVVRFPLKWFWAISIIILLLREADFKFRFARRIQLFIIWIFKRLSSFRIFSVHLRWFRSGCVIFSVCFGFGSCCFGSVFRFNFPRLSFSLTFPTHRLTSLHLLQLSNFIWKI